MKEDDPTPAVVARVARTILSALVAAFPPLLLVVVVVPLRPEQRRLEYNPKVRARARGILRAGTGVADWQAVLLATI